MLWDLFFTSFSAAVQGPRPWPSWTGSSHSHECSVTERLLHFSDTYTCRLMSTTDYRDRLY